MTKYSVSIETETSFQPVALFDELASMDAMIAFAEYQFENGNSLETPGINVRILDLTTGEVVWDWREENEYCDIPDDVDETFYDPYAGCDMYDFCDFDGGDF